uniref:Uncharacterized protein n=1 Tax=Strigamia maritima TaxID=126957 RepID=T1ILA6_STRMM
MATCDGAPGAEGRAGVKGSKGDVGMKGEKGQEGSFDFLLLVLADVRHDIEMLQEAVFRQQTPARYDIASAAAHKRFTNQPQP